MMKNSDARTLDRIELSRRGLLGLGGAVGLVVLTGCGTTTSPSTGATATATASASGGSAADGNTPPRPGTYTPTFATTTDAAGGGPGGGASKSQILSGAYLVNGIDATIDGGTWESTTADQNVFLVVNGGSLTLTNATIAKSGDSSNEEACNFYGLNAAILVVDDGSSATIRDCTVTTDAEGANAIFAASTGAITIGTVTIKTT